VDITAHASGRQDQRPATSWSIGRANEALTLLSGVREQRHLARALDRDRQYPLMPSAVS